MKAKLLFLALVISHISKSQNLILNNSFESGDLSYPDCNSVSVSTNLFDYLDVWESQYFYDIFCPQAGASHSPDWRECPSSGWDGNCYIGVGPYESAQQVFKQKLSDKGCYVIRMKVRTTLASAHNNIDDILPSWDFYSLDVILSKGFLSYQDPSLNDGGCTNNFNFDADYISYTQPAIWDDFATVARFDPYPLEVGKWAANTSTTTIYNFWYDVVAEFNADFNDDAKFYDRFVLDLRSETGQTGGSYAPVWPNIDFIELYPKCPEFYDIDGVHLAGSQTKYECSKRITAGKIAKGNVVLDFNANSEYKAGKYIELIPGFETSTGAVLDARIEGCTSCRQLGKQAEKENGRGDVVSDETPKTERDTEVFPNPASSQITVHSSGILKSAVLTDLTGRIITTFQPDPKEPTQTFELPNVKAGIYLLTLTNDNGKTEVKKLAIEK